jgi:hypothetical protein
MLQWLSGKKTYLLGGAVVAWGVFLFATGNQEEGSRRVIEGLALVFLRQGVAKSGVQ